MAWHVHIGRKRDIKKNLQHQRINDTRTMTVSEFIIFLTRLSDSLL